METSPKDIAIPNSVLYELELSIANSNEARMTAKNRAQLENNGTPIEPYDYLIAVTALSNNGVLVTNNTNKFNRVKI